MATESAPLHFVPKLPDEEAARANFYGLLARLFYAPPDAALLQTLAASAELETEEGGIGLAWRDLALAAAAADPETVREEYETAFIGVDKAPITLYTSAYSVRYTNEVPLAELRAVLSAFGLGRRHASLELEDHVSALCEVMRFLIAEQKRSLEEQKAFFERWIRPIVEPLCGAIEKSQHTLFYKPVARLFAEVCTIEHRGFEML